jgi:hypothetical protein
MNIQKDKIKHFSVSLALMLVLGAVNIHFGIILAVSIGIAKEVYDDKSGKGTPDIYDIVANWIGIVAGYLILLV